jgi:hypothetical protein
LSLRRRFCNVRGALGGVGRSVVNHVIVKVPSSNCSSLLIVASRVGFRVT